MCASLLSEMVALGHLQTGVSIHVQLRELHSLGAKAKLQDQTGCHCFEGLQRSP